MYSKYFSSYARKILYSYLFLGDPTFYLHISTRQIILCWSQTEKEIAYVTLFLVPTEACKRPELGGISK